MNVTDSQRASSAALLMVGSLAASVGLTLLFYAVGAFAPGGYDSPFRLVEEALWLVVMAVLVVGLLQLAAAVDDPLWLRAAAGLASPTEPVAGAPVPPPAGAPGAAGAGLAAGVGVIAARYAAMA